MKRRTPYFRKLSEESKHLRHILSLRHNMYPVHIAKIGTYFQHPENSE